VTFRAEPELGAEERIVDTFRVRRTEELHAVKGTLWVTTTHLRFRAPILVHGPTGVAGDWSWGEVERVDLARRTLRRGPFMSGFRHRLRLHLSDGKEELFFVRRVRRKVSYLQNLREAARPTRRSTA
jgi:hypothetical protein